MQSLEIEIYAYRDSTISNSQMKDDEAKIKRIDSLKISRITMCNIFSVKQC